MLHIEVKLIHAHQPPISAIWQDQNEKESIQEDIEEVVKWLTNLCDQWIEPPSSLGQPYSLEIHVGKAWCVFGVLLLQALSDLIKSRSLSVNVVFV